MSAAVTNDLVYEILKQIQSQIALLRDDMDSVKTRLTSIDTRLGLVHTDMAHQADRLDRLESRLGRVETRLNFTDEKQKADSRGPGGCDRALPGEESAAALPFGPRSGAGSANYVGRS